MTPIPSPSPLSIWVVSDGRAGIENQALGLAEAVKRLTPAEITIKHIRWRPVFDRLPSALKTAAMLDPASDPIAAPWPDLWIATGRATLPLSTRVKTWSAGKTFVVQTQDPRWANHRYDMIIAPAHDGLSGDNVFEITGSPHRITAERIAEAAPAFADHILVTEDSANMAAEAASTGKPVHILPMIPLKSGGKFARLHDDLQSRGATRPLDGTLDSWTYEALAETDRAARAVLEAMRAR